MQKFICLSFRQALDKPDKFGEHVLFLSAEGTNTKYVLFPAYRFRTGKDSEQLYRDMILMCLKVAKKHHLRQVLVPDMGVTSTDGGYGSHVFARAILEAANAVSGITIRVVCSDHRIQQVLTTAFSASGLDRPSAAIWNQCPIYWTTFQQLRVVDVPAGSTEASDLRCFCARTWNSATIGMSADAKGLEAIRAFRVVKIQRVQYPKLFIEYTSRRDAIRQSDGFIAEIEEHLQPEHGPNIQGLSNRLDPGVNEYFLFHGSTADRLPGLIADGFDVRLASKDAMYGPGIYFTSAFSKADQYADSKTQRNLYGNLHILVCRVVLGRAYVADKPKKFPRPPCREPNCVDSKKSGICTKHSSRFDSVLGHQHDKNTPLLDQEYVIYDGRQCYIEYIVTYNRM